jgi:hypothetical protein
MAFDEGLAQRLREILAHRSDISEKKMFGGLAFMLSGHMCVGITGEDLMVRVGPDDHEAALTRPHARVMDFTGRSLKGFVYVGPEGVAADDDLAGWTARAVTYAETLPPK